MRHHGGCASSPRCRGGSASTLDRAPEGGSMSTDLTGTLAALLRSMRDAERDVFGGLDPDVRDRPLRAGDWSPKDHQAHLTAWKARQANRYAAARRGEEPAEMSDGQIQ